LPNDKTINELLTENSATSYCLLKQLIHKEKEVVTLIFSPLENQSLKTDQLISNKLLIYVYIPNNRWID
jgi:Gpi18-like mannosyltransferase